MNEVDTAIASVECWVCSIPLPTPLDFGTYTITSREYVAVRVRTHGGLIADCVGLSRSAPVDLAITEVLGQHLIGRDGADPEGCLAAVATGTRALDQVGIVGAAKSLIATCLCDIRAQAAGLPLWRSLGGEVGVEPLPVLLVEGYALPDEDDEAYAERLAARVVAGYTAIKVEAASYRDPSQLGRRLSRFRELVGDDAALVVDLAWSWNSASEAVKSLEHWFAAGIAWIEDPMLRHRVDEIRRLRRASACPIGAGDEATSIDEIAALVKGDAIDVVRIDALTVGGPEAARALTELAAARGKSVSTHAHPEIHQHCCFAWPGHKYIEEFPIDRPFDFTHLLIGGDVLNHPRPGFVAPPTSPGSGVQLMTDAVEHFSRRYSRIS